MDKQKVLEKANENLEKRFKSRHKAITMADIEKAYGRMLLGIEADAKTTKGSKNGYMTGILYLAPANISGINTCPGASKGCIESCLFEAGRGVMAPVYRARVIKTLAFYFDTPRFEKAIAESIRKLKVKAKNKNMTPVVRLNGTSDILWERRTNIIQSHSDTIFYDYTKVSARFEPGYELPFNYDLTFSVHETNHRMAQKVLENGGRVAAVFRDSLPDTHWNAQVIDGDSTDLRFLDATGVIIGLKAKGSSAKKDTSGFVLDASQGDKMLKVA